MKPKTRSEFLSNGPSNSITYGSTDTKIRKLATTVINLVGSKMQYFSAGGTSAPGGVGGAEFVATVSGYYHIDYYDTAGTGSSFHGLSLNSAQRTTSIDAITGLNKLAISGGTSGPVTGNPSYCAVSRWFDAGDIIRPHSYGTAGSAIEQIFYMTFRGFE
jgi:hypothetical protein